MISLKIVIDDTCCPQTHCMFCCVFIDTLAGELYFIAAGLPCARAHECVCVMCACMWSGQMSGLSRTKSGNKHMK